MPNLGDKLLFLIEKNEMNQKEFAALINVTPQSLNNYVKNKRVPDVDTINRICDVLGCSADYLFGRQTGAYFPLSAEEKDLIKAWRNSDSDLKELILRSLGLRKKKKNKHSVFS